MRSPWVWFIIGLVVLGPVQIGFVASDPWFQLPPKPIGDGPDYENIAFHLSQGRGWSMGWTDPGWREPYLLVNEQLPKVPLATGGHAQASYEVQLRLTGELSPTTARPPLLPTLIAFEYRLLPRSAMAFAAVRVFLASCLAIAGAMAAAMSARLLRTWTERSWPVALAAIVTIVLAALDRTVRSYATDFLTEPIALLLLQLWIFSATEALYCVDCHQTIGPSSGKKQLRFSVLCGILLGLLIYTRSLIVLWLPAVGLLMALAPGIARLRKTKLALDNGALLQGKSHSGWRLAACMLLTCLLVCSPWWIRNCLVLKTWMPLGTQGPITLVGGYSDDAILADGQWQMAPEQRLRQRVSGDELDVARQASREVSAWISAHKGQLLTLAWTRLRTEWNPYSGRALIWKLMALTGLCFLARAMPRSAWILGGIIAINSLTVMVLYSVGGRFLVPTYGILYTLGGIGVAGVLCMALPRAGG